MIVLPLIPSRLDAEALDVELGVQVSDVRGAGVSTGQGDLMPYT